ncbi:transposase family protein [Nonomuraea sp. NPDC046802]|uniref:transposase family protein n=1 Tax=Nonomuraea sp. NPDC046802 TaxID=3154919 RepID=UPI0033FD127E
MNCPGLVGGSQDWKAGNRRIVARTGSEQVACRSCGEPAARVHDRHRRRLQDLACGGRPVQIELKVRRLICDNPACLSGQSAT